MRTKDNSLKKAALKIYSDISKAISKENTSPEGKMNMWGVIGLTVIIVLQIIISKVEYLGVIIANCIRGYKTDWQDDITVQLLIIAGIFVACLVFMGFVIIAHAKFNMKDEKKKDGSDK